MKEIVACREQGEKIIQSKKCCSTSIIVTAGLAEIVAGSIAMGLGGYLVAKSDAEHYASERRREQLEIKEKPEAEKAEIMEVFTSYGLTAEESKLISAPGLSAPI